MITIRRERLHMNYRATTRRTLGIVAAMLLASAAPLSISSLANASTPPPGSEAAKIAGTSTSVSTAINPDRVLIANQESLDRVVDRITGRLSEFERAKIPGFGDVAVDPAQNHLRLYWKGKTPDNVNSILASLPAGMTAEVVPARYSKAELHSAREKLIQNGKAVTIPSQLTTAASRITSIAPAVDGSGLEIGYDEDRGVGHRDSTDPLSPSARQDKSREVKAAADALTGVDTHISYQPLSVDLSNRGEDSSPWWGGAALKNPGDGGICSSGFGVHRNYDGANFLTSAYHCGTSGTWSTWIGNDTIGWSYGDENAPDDVVGIVPASGSTGSQVYDGGAQSNTGYAKPVADWGHNNAGDLVCTSGANSGVHCNVQILQTDIGMTGWNGVYRPYTDLASQQDGWSWAIATADGDSGGPVFSLTNGGASDVARGTITANKYTTGCPGSVLNDMFVSSKPCYGGTYFVPIYQTLTDMQWSLNTQ